MRCSAPSSVAAAGKKGEYVTCLICHQKVSFNKYSWTTPRQHMRKHKIHSPSDLETVLQLAKQCWKEGRDFPEERLPRAGNSKGRPQTRKIIDYQAGGGFRPARKRDNGIQPGAKGYELMDRNGLPPLCHYRHACILRHVMRVGPVSPGSGPKECHE